MSYRNTFEGCSKYERKACIHYRIMCLREIADFHAQYSGFSSLYPYISSSLKFKRLILKLEIDYLFENRHKVRL